MYESIRNCQLFFNWIGFFFLYKKCNKIGIFVAMPAVRTWMRIWSALLYWFVLVQLIYRYWHMQSIAGFVHMCLCVDEAHIRLSHRFLCHTRFVHVCKIVRSTELLALHLILWSAVVGVKTRTALNDVYDFVRSIVPSTHNRRFSDVQNGQKDYSFRWKEFLQMNLFRSNAAL